MLLLYSFTTPCRKMLFLQPLIQPLLIKLSD